MRARIDRELADGWQLSAAGSGGEIVGLLALKVDPPILDQLFVAPDHQGRGIGAVLLAEAKRRLPGGFELRTALGNEGACRFYLRESLVDAGEGSHPRFGTPVRFFRYPGR